MESEGQGSGLGDDSPWELEAALDPELSEALNGLAELARRKGQFDLALSLERRLVPAPAFRLELLGPSPRLLLDRPLFEPYEVPWRLKRAFSTFALLSLEKGRRAPREALVEALWGEESAESIRRNFHPLLSDLRRTLLDALELVACVEKSVEKSDEQEVLFFRLGIYHLEMHLPFEVDAESFEQRVAAAETARQRGDEDQALLLFRQAWRLYTGPLLEGFEGEWLQRRRETLHQVYLRTLRQIGAIAMRREEDLLATDAFRSLLFEEPFDESVHLELMRLYARSGRRDLVRRQFVRLQENLKELDVEPLRPTQEEFHRLMR